MTASLTAGLRHRRIQARFSWRKRAVLADLGLIETDGAEAVAWTHRAVRSNRRRPPLAAILRLTRPVGLVRFIRMNLQYSMHDARARFSEVIRHVREGKTVTVSRRGEPVAEIRPVQRSSETIEERLDELERRGALVRSGRPWKPPAPATERPGALERFLADRNE